MKKYTIGLITGAFLAISAMMFMGASTSSSDFDYEINENNLYQINKKTGDISVIALKDADFKKLKYAGNMFKR